MVFERVWSLGTRMEKRWGEGAPTFTIQIFIVFNNSTCIYYFRTMEVNGRDLLFLRINLKIATVFLLVLLMDVKNSLLLYYIGVISRPTSLYTIQLRNSVCFLTAAKKDCHIGQAVTLECLNAEGLTY